MKNLANTEVLTTMMHVADVLNDFFEEDFAVGITDCEKFLKMIPGKTLDLKTYPGDPIIEGSGIHKAIKEKRQVTSVIPKEVYGVPFKSTCTPIFDESGKVVGCIGIGLNLERQEKLKGISEEFASAFQEILASVDSMSNEAQQLAAQGQKMASFGSKSEEGLADVEKVIEYVRKVSAQTNLLGLNASIEAARAGEAGRGFAVVAEEIRRLSESTAGSVEGINETIAHTKEAVGKMLEYVNSVGEATEEQASAIEEVTATMQELSARVQELAEMARSY